MVKGFAQGALTTSDGQHLQRAGAGDVPVRRPSSRSHSTVPLAFVIGALTVQPTSPEAVAV